MPVLEDLKRTIEKITGLGRPQSAEIRVRSRKAHTYVFTDDGEIPNNPHFPLILYRSPVMLDSAFDPAAIFEVTFANNGWKDSWRDGVYDFLHFHTATHEVLGIARGYARVQFGGRSGRILQLRAGDVVILPAGTGHQRKSQSKNLLVVGAYSAGGKYDEPKPDDVDGEKARRSIAKVRKPTRDPVYGADGALNTLWKSRKT